MSCTFEKDKLTGYFDSELDAGEREEVERHIASCSECLRELGELKSASTLVRSLPRVKAPGAIAQAVAREIAPAPAPRATSRRKLLPWAVAAAAAILVALNIVFVANLSNEKSADRQVSKSAPTVAQAPTDSMNRADEEKKTPKENPNGPAKKNEADALALDKRESPGRAKEGKDKDAYLREEGGKAEEGVKEEAKKKNDVPEERQLKKETPETQTAKGDDPKQTGENDKSKAQQDRMQGQSRKPPETPPQVYTITASRQDMATARAQVEKTMKDMGLVYKAGAGEFERDADAKTHHENEDTVMVVELNDAELEALQNQLKGNRVLTFSRGYDGPDERSRFSGGRRALKSGDDDQAHKETEKKLEPKPSGDKEDAKKREDAGANKGGGSGTTTGKDQTKAAEASPGRGNKPSDSEPAAKSATGGKDEKAEAEAMRKRDGKQVRRKVILYFKELQPAEKK